MSSSSSKGAFKICLGDKIHKVLTLPKDLNAFKELITYFFGLQLPAQWTLQYLDVDGDVITVSNDFDYRALLEERTVRINIVPIDQNLVNTTATQSFSREDETTTQKSIIEQEEISSASFILEHSESNISIVTEGNFGYSQDSGSQRKKTHQTLAQMKDKQRRRALKVVDNLKRSDISEAKKEKLGTLLEEIKDNIALIKQKQAKAQAKAEEEQSILIAEKSSTEVAQVENQQKISPSKKQLANRKRANLKRDLKVSYKNYSVGEEVDDENDDDGYEFISRPTEKFHQATLSIEEKAKKIKEIFTNIDLEVLSFFLKENPQLGVEELVQNYITA